MQHLIDDLDHSLPFLRDDQYLCLADGAVNLDQSELVQRLNLVAHPLRPRYAAVDVALHHRRHLGDVYQGSENMLPLKDLQCCGSLPVLRKTAVGEYPTDLLRQFLEREGIQLNIGPAVKLATQRYGALTPPPHPGGSVHLFLSYFQSCGLLIINIAKEHV